MAEARTQAAKLEEATAAHAKTLARFLDEHFAYPAGGMAAHHRLIEAIRYSLLQEGGKRFRPVLAMFTAEALGKSANVALPFGAAIECIHTYSLIHDDLPAMDNDDYRRGKLTNHKVYGEDMAILAGDALLGEAFQIIAACYAPEVGLRLVTETARASGMNGMVGGQAVDMAAKKETVTLAELRVMHSLKTGALIRVSARGAAIASRASDQQIEEISTYAENLGLAFQVADDLLDYDQEKPEPGSYPALLGPAKSRRFLDELTDTCLDSLEDWPDAADSLRQIARYNRDRSR